MKINNTKKIIGYTSENVEDWKIELEDWLFKLGFIPLQLPMHDNSWINNIQFLDALILTGGGHISSQIAEYDKPKKCKWCNITRDVNELKLLKGCHSKIPILGICRGMQLLWTYLKLGSLKWYKNLDVELINRGIFKHSFGSDFKVNFKWLPYTENWMDYSDKIIHFQNNYPMTIRFDELTLGTMFHLNSSKLHNTDTLLFKTFLEQELNNA